MSKGFIHNLINALESYIPSIQDSFGQMGMSGTHSFYESLENMSITPPPISHRPMRNDENFTSREHQSNLY